MWKLKEEEKADSNAPVSILNFKKFIQEAASTHRSETGLTPVRHFPGPYGDIAEERPLSAISRVMNWHVST